MADLHSKILDASCPGGVPSFSVSFVPNNRLAPLWEILDPPLVTTRLSFAGDKEKNDNLLSEVPTGAEELN